MASSWAPKGCEPPGGELRYSRLQMTNCCRCPKRRPSFSKSMRGCMCQHPGSGTVHMKHAHKSSLCLILCWANVAGTVALARSRLAAVRCHGDAGAELHQQIANPSHVLRWNKLHRHFLVPRMNAPSQLRMNGSICLSHNLGIYPHLRI